MLSFVMFIRVFAFVGFLSISLASFGQVFDERFEDWPVDLKINGKVVIAGELEDWSILEGVISEKERSLSVGFLVGTKVDGADVRGLKEFFGEGKLEFQDIGDFEASMLQKAFRKHGVVVLYKKQSFTKLERAAVVRLKKNFEDFVGRGGVLVALGGSAEIVSGFYMEEVGEGVELRKGLNLIPDVFVEIGYDDKRERKRLLKEVADRPRCVGIGLASNTALVLSGRKVRVAGNGTATFLLPGNDRVSPRVRTLTSVKQRRSRDPESVLLDLTQWRRDAIDRTLPVFPAVAPRPPLVENGSLLIVGGGRTPAGLTKQMIEMAGGVDKARLVYIPCSENDDVAEEQRVVALWKRMGVKHATFIHTKDRNKANTDEEFLEPLKNATCIYFGGGRQWNFSDSYYGTKAHKLMKDVLKRGGVIAGSSAGASIQGRYLARATPISNYKIMAFGYERGGLGFLDGVAIDQHFSERGRQKDMTRLVAKHTQLLGIGIDESTAIIVRGSKAKVIGKGRVFFYDRRRILEPNKPDYIALPAGSEFDLVRRQVLKNAADR